MQTIIHDNNAIKDFIEYSEADVSKCQLHDYYWMLFSQKIFSADCMSI